MKRTLVIIMAVFLATVAVASGDELDDLLPLAADEPLRLSARQMIGVGINLDDVLALTRAMHQNRFTNAQAVTAQALVVGAAQKGLPTGPLMDKAYEGMVKKVPNDRIVAAIKTVRARYAFAYGQASAITANKENQRRIGNVIAAAMSAGLGQTDVATITSRLRDRSGRQSPSNSAALAAASFETSRDMVRTGVSSDSARDLVCEALQHNYDAHKIQALGQAFRTRSRMESPQGLAHRFTRSVGQGQDVPSAQNRSHTGSPGSLGNDGPLGNSGSSGRSGSQKGPDASAGPSSSGNAGGSENGNSSGSSGEAGSNGNSGGSNGSSNGSGNGGSVGSGGTHGGAKGAGGSGGSGI